MLFELLRDVGRSCWHVSSCGYNSNTDEENIIAASGNREASRGYSLKILDGNSLNSTNGT